MVTERPEVTIDGRTLGRWSPSFASITLAASELISQHGGTGDDDWLRLPDAWEPLVTKVDAFDDSSPAAQVQLAGAFGDAEIAAHGGADQARTLRAQHHRWVDGWIERGDEACLELAAQLLTGADLVAACEHALDRHFKLAVSAIATLARHPDAPVSGRVRARATRLRTDALRPRAMPPIHGHRHRRSSERLAKPRRRSVARDRDTLPDRLN